MVARAHRIRFKPRFRLALGVGEFLVIGLIALSYAATELIHGIDSLAVFAAGLAMRRIESTNIGQKSLHHRQPQEVVGKVLASDNVELATQSGQRLGIHD